MAGSCETERSATVFLGHNGLEIGGGLVLRLRLARSPFHDKAVADAAEHSDEPNAAGGLYPATRGLLPCLPIFPLRDQRTRWALSRALRLYRIAAGSTLQLGQTRERCR